MQVGVDVKCMHTNFGGRGLFGFRDTVTFKNGQISLSTHGRCHSNVVGCGTRLGIQVGVSKCLLIPTFGSDLVSPHGPNNCIVCNAINHECTSTKYNSKFT